MFDIYNCLISILIIIFSLYIYKIIIKKKLIINKKFAVVTGSSSGIGLGIAKELLKNGCKVILVARNKDRLIQLTNDFKKEGYEECYYICADLSKENDIEEFKKSVDQILLESNQKSNLNQHVEILINCAGSGIWKFIEDTSFKECQDMMSLPFFAAFNVTRILIKSMLESGSGTIVNINSPAALQPWQGCIGYSCSRWALRGFSESLKMELYGTGVNVIDVILGKIDTKYYEKNGITYDSLPILANVPAVSIHDTSIAIVKSIINKEDRLLYPFSLHFGKILRFYPFNLLSPIILSSKNSKKRIDHYKTNKNK